MASLCNADDDELGPEYDDEQLDDVSANEPTTEAPQDENEEHRRIWRLKNAKCTQHRQNVENRARNPMYERNLNNAFAAAADREYHTPIGAISEAALLAQQLPSNPQIQRMQYLTQLALVQLNGQHPASSTQNLPLRFERHGDTALISRTPRGGPKNRKNDSRQCNEGHHDKQGNDNGHFDKGQRNHSGNPRKRKLDQEVTTVEHNPCGKKSGNIDTQFEKVLHKQCPMHQKSRHTLFECVSLRKSLNAPPLPQAGKRKDQEEDDEGDKSGAQDFQVPKNVVMSSLAETADSPLSACGS
ncbi:hypothetical protein C2845_PM10G12240 [Panicum miliaceum]|uniref:Uncharacterized protein n=1 Tax=Panicum miliaceum TaxID=4540 RepID=A0A3L6PD78_PANMI|nr:hypothetical protein C2845_PM10G12240 [Panicum miliaceum]